MFDTSGATAVGVDADAVGGLGFKVGAGGEAQRVAEDVEGGVVRAAGACDEAVSEGIAAVGIGAAEGADSGVGTRVFGESRAAQSDVGRHGVQAGACDGKGVGVLVAIVVGEAQRGAAEADGAGVKGDDERGAAAGRDG